MVLIERTPEIEEDVDEETVNLFPTWSAVHSMLFVVTLVLRIVAFVLFFFIKNSFG
jgi:hypothetical protein